MFIDSSTSDTLVKMGFGGAAFYFAIQIYDKTVNFLAQKKDNGNGTENAGGQSKEFWLSAFREIVQQELKTVHTFASAPDIYWRNIDNSLEKSVTKPIADILERQTKLLEKLAEHSAEDRGRLSVRKR